MTQGGSLKIENLELSDSGVYQCFASNAAGETKVSAWIKVDRKSEDFAKLSILVVMPTKLVDLTKSVFIVNMFDFLLSRLVETNTLNQVTC